MRNKIVNVHVTVMMQFPAYSLETQLAYKSGPPTAHQRYAIEMAYRCRVVGSPTVKSLEFLYLCIYRRMAENGFAPPLGNFADISYLVEN